MLSLTRGPIGERLPRSRRESLTVNWEAIGAVGELVSGIVVVATLFYLARQIRQNTHQTHLSSLQAINASNDSAFDPIYIPENSKIFTKGQASFSTLSEHEKVVFDMLMTRLIASFDTTTYQYVNGAYDADLYRGGARFFSTFVTSPGGAEWMAMRGDVFSEACRQNLAKYGPGRPS